MTPPVSFSVKSGQLHLLGTLLPGERSGLSPLLPALDGKDREDAKRSLTGCSVLDAQGEISERYRTMLGLLSGTTRLVSLSLFFSDRSITTTRYFHVSGNATVTVTERNGTMVEILDAISPQEILAAAGLSDDEINQNVLPLDIRVSKDEAALFAALLDGERASVAAALAGVSPDDDTPLAPFVHTAQSVHAAMTGFLAGTGDYPAQKVMSDITGQTPGMQPSGIAPLLSRMVAKGIVSQSGSGYQLSDAVLLMARRMVLTDFVMDVTLRQDDGRLPPSGEEAYCIRADGALTWFIMRSGSPDTITIRYMPAGMLAAFAGQIMTNAGYSLSAIESLTVPAPAQQPQKTPAKKFCPSCGAPLKAGAKFCNNCGSKIA